MAWDPLTVTIAPTLSGSPCARPLRETGVDVPVPDVAVEAAPPPVGTAFSSPPPHAAKTILALLSVEALPKGLGVVETSCVLPPKLKSPTEHLPTLARL